MDSKARYDIFIITTTWNKTIAVTGDTIIDYKKPSTVLETQK